MRVPQFTRGLAVGATAAYVLDRASYRHRRATLRDRANHFVHQLGKAAGRTTRHAHDQGRRALASVTSRLRSEGLDDAVLVERVRAAIGRELSHPGSINVSVDNGRIQLAGTVPARELDNLVATVESVRGVRNVVHNLILHESAAGVSGVQGGTPQEPRFEPRQRNWSPTARALTGAGGAVIAITSRRLSSPARQLTSLFGLGIVARAVTNIESKRLAGIQAGRRAVVVHKTIEVAAPIDQVFDFLSRFENYPRFMAHLIAVQRTSDRTSHWLARGPGGTPFHWIAEITNLEPNRRLAWRSVAGPTIQNTGVVRFDSTPDGGTRVDIRLSYQPPAGAVGQGLASLLGAYPRQALDEDLGRLKSLMDPGKVNVRGESAERVELSATRRDG